MHPLTKLRGIKTLHTIVWVVFAGSILAIPAFTSMGQPRVAWALIAFVLLEVVVLVLNRMRCPLTGIAARYTPARQGNFDIYLPLWLATCNKEIFGGLYVAAIVHAIWNWVGAST